MKKNSLYILFKAFLISSIVLASESALGSAAGHENTEIPISTVMYQIINLGILLIGLFFAVRKSVSMLFKTRLINFNEQAEKTAAATLLAENTLLDIKSKIQNLDNNELVLLVNAKKEAEELKNKTIAEAKVQSDKIKNDSHLIIAAELNNAKNEIRKEIISAAVEVAKINIKNESESITKKSEQGFLKDLAQTKTQAGL